MSIVLKANQWRSLGGRRGWPAPGVTIFGWHHLMTPIEQKRQQKYI